MEKDNDLDLIIDYINGELSNDQKFKFEERLSKDMDLLESLRIQKEIHNAFLRMQISEQVQSIHEEAIGSSMNFEAKSSIRSSENANKVQSNNLILRKIAAVFISIMFIGSLWTWYYQNSGSTKPISNYVTPIEKDNTITPPSDKQNNIKNDSIQNMNEESYLKRIDIVLLNPDVSFGFGQKNEVSKNIFLKRISNSPIGLNSMYRLNADTLFLYINAHFESEEILLYEIQHEEESQSSLENGFYLSFDNAFYQLDKINKLNKLILLENKSQLSEINKMIKKK